MPQQDQVGLDLTGASPKAAEAYAQAFALYQRLGGEPMALVDEAIADSPEFVMAHVLRATMLLVGANPQITKAGLRALKAAETLAASEREQAHVAALSAIAAGEMRRAGRIFEDISIAHPHDALALQAGQIMDFNLGDARMLRDRIARALPHWSDNMPGHHAVLGMLAFGLEETGFYAQAEAAGQRALELEPANAWAQHAVAHVMEMQNRREAGIAFMRRESTGWTQDSYFAIHNWWHLALFHLGLGDLDGAMALYDGPIYGEDSDVSFDLLDAAALLWRLDLDGATVGDRWARLAGGYERKGGFGLSAFDDAHAMLAFVGAGREDEVQALLAAQEEALAAPGDNAGMVRDVGLPVMEGLRAFGVGDYRTAMDRLRTVRNAAARFGGSHAQRDLIDLTLIAAARRGGDASLEHALLAERVGAHELAASPTPR